MNTCYAHARYRELLYPRGHGYPFWIPEPNDALPQAQKVEGVRLGDVGILTDDGGFEYLWNVHLPADHPYNKPRAPSNFKPLASLNETLDVRRIDAFFDDQPISSSSVKKREIKLEAKVEPPLVGGIVGGGAGFEFSTDGNSGAILTLPRGGSRIDALKRSLYQKYAATHAESWYRHINQELQLGVLSGALYLVTGTDKCSSWAVASFAESSASHSFTLNFVASGAASTDLSIKNSWSADFGVDHRAKVVDPSELSQCVFARGFAISVRDSVWAQICGMSVKTTSLYGTDALPSFFGSSRPFARGAESDPDVYIQPVPERLAHKSPAALLGDELLNKNDDASFAVVHDEDWIAFTRHGDLLHARGLEDPFLETLIDHAVRQSNTIVVDGVCIVVDADDAVADGTSNAILSDASAGPPRWDSVRVDTVADALLHIQQHGPSQATRVVSSPTVIERPEVVPARYLTRLPVVTRTSGSLSSPDVQPQLFAIIIGINVYEHAQAGSALDNLKGAVADADDMLEFLTSALSADHSHIINLRDQEATRDGILDAFAALTSDDRIQRGDPIVIFFAGHGSQSGWTTGAPDSRVDMLIPYDFLPATTTKLNQQGILYSTVEGLLRNLAKEKGDNITVILDACRSGSLIRDPLDLGVLSRGINLPDGYAMLPSMQDEEYRRAKVAFPYEPSSHALLSGCSEMESAYECNGRGVFTLALLKLLRYANVCNLSYRGVIEQLPDLPLQHPKCESKYSARALFDGKAPGRSWFFYPVKVIQTAGKLTLCGGEVHGITEGAEFDVFATRDFDAQPLCRLVAMMTYACSADLAPVAGTVVHDIPQPAWALQATVGKRADLVVALSPAREFLHVLEIALEMENRPNKRTIRFADPEVPHELELQVNGDRVVFIVADQLCNDARVTRLPRTVSMDDPALVYAVIESAVDFFYHLRCSNPAAPLAGKVIVEAFELQYRDSVNLVEGGLMQIKIIDRLQERPYGFKLVSTWPHDLYVWVFMFDISSFKIDILYHDRLPAQGLLTLGYGTSEISPRAFFLSDGASADVSYLKVYITPEYVDLSHIVQQTPFNARLTRNMGIQKRLTLHGVWDTVLVAVIQMAAK